MKKERYRIKVIDRDYSEKESLSIVKNMIHEGNDFSTIVDNSLDLGLNLSGEEIQDMIDDFNYYKENNSYLNKQAKKYFKSNPEMEGKGFVVFTLDNPNRNKMYYCKKGTKYLYEVSNAIIYPTSETAKEKAYFATKNSKRGYTWEVKPL